MIGKRTDFEIELERIDKGIAELNGSALILPVDSGQISRLADLQYQRASLTGNLEELPVAHATLDYASQQRGRVGDLGTRGRCRAGGGRRRHPAKSLQWVAAPGRPSRRHRALGGPCGGLALPGSAREFRINTDSSSASRTAVCVWSVFDRISPVVSVLPPHATTARAAVPLARLSFCIPPAQGSWTAGSRSPGAKARVAIASMTHADAITTVWASLERHFAHHARLVARFRSFGPVAVARMLREQRNEAGAPLSRDEREALVERHCELFGSWPV